MVPLDRDGWACGLRNSTTHLGLLDPFAEIPKQAGGMAHARFEGVATTPTMTCVVTYNGWIRSSKGRLGSRTYVREAANSSVDEHGAWTFF